MNKKQAEDFIYKSYLKAQRYQDYHAKDSEKRRNDLTYDLIRKKSHTPCTVVTGSKGKGSVANMISQILQTKYTVGLMTSPHIVDFCERFRVNGGKISDEDFIKNILLIQKEMEEIDASIPENICISPMGIQAYLALNYFEEQRTEFNIFECGKGARFDDVNNIKHDYAVINSIFLEHTRELGETIEEIAEDKAYVITEKNKSIFNEIYCAIKKDTDLKEKEYAEQKRNMVTGEQKCVYVAEQIPSVMKVIQDRADRLNVPLKIYGKDFWAENICYTKEGMKFDIVVGEEVYSDIRIPLLGGHQARNCALAFALCKDVLKDLKLLKIKEKLLRINWPGRMEVIRKNPFILLDACINRSSCKNVLEVLEQLEIEKASFIIGIPDDKDYAGVVKGVKRKASQIILTKSQNPHYVFTKRQQEILKEEGIEAVWTQDILEAINLSMEKDEYIVILGTTSVVAEVKELKI